MDEVNHEAMCAKTYTFLSSKWRQINWNVTKWTIGVADGGQPPPPKKKIRKKYFSGNYYVKFWHFRAKIT